MAETKTTIRLGTDGAAQVRADFAAIGAAGTAAMGDIAAATAATGAANDRWTQRQLDGFAKQAAAAKLAAAAERNRGSFDDFVGNTLATRNGVESLASGSSMSAGSARASAEAFGLLAPAAKDAATEIEHVNGMIGLNRSQTVIAQSAVLRFVDTLVAGQSPLRAFALEAHKIPEVLSVDDGGMAGGLAKVTALLTPFNIGVAAVSVGLIAGAVAVYEYTAAREKLDAISRGSGALIGATGDQLEMSAEKAAAAGHITVGAARDIETAYVNMGKIGLAVLPGLTAATTDFAAATGTDVKTATETLGKAFADPVKGAEDLTARYGLLDQAQIAEVRAAVAVNDELRAQKILLDAVAGATGHAAEQVGFLGRLWQNFKADVSGKLDFTVKAIDDAFDGLPKLEKLTLLQKDLAAARANYSGSQFQDGHIAALEKEVAAQQKLVDADNARVTAKKNVAVANAQDERSRQAVAKFTGDDELDGYRKTQADLAASVARGHRENAAALDAYTHAIETHLSPAEKKRQLDEAEVKVAAAKTPAEKAAAAAAKERIDQSGKLVTSAEAEADAHAKGAAAAATAAKSGDGHAATLAREAAAMDVAAAASLGLARAYLAGGTAAVEADARRKAATDATKKGIDVESEVRRQLAENVADGAATGAKALAGLRDETEARNRLNALVATGVIGVAAANARLKDEAVLRPLLKLQAVAQGDALTTLTAVINTYRGALDDAHASENRSATDRIVADAKDTIAGLHDAADFAGDRTGQGAVEIARRAALRAAAQVPDLDAGQANERATSAAAVETNKLYADRAKYLVQSATGQHDAIEYARAELATLGQSDDARTRILDRLKEEQTLRNLNLGFSADQVRSILAGADAEEAMKLAVAHATTAMTELKNEGGRLIDDVLNPSNWSSWGALGQTVLHDLESEFIRLAALDPIKNLLGIGGGNLPTLGSVGGLFGSLFGGGGDPITGGIGSLVASNSSYLDSLGPVVVPHNDAGTDYFSGGATWIGENGPEKVTLPRGSRIDNAAATRQSAATAGGNRGDVHQHFYLDGAVVDQSLYAKMAAIGVNAQVGGAALSAQNYARARRYALA